MAGELIRTAFDVVFPLEQWTCGLGHSTDEATLFSALIVFVLFLILFLNGPQIQHNNLLDRFILS